MNVCVYCKVGNHGQCLGVTYRTSPDTAAWRAGERDGPPCECTHEDTGLLGVGV